MHLVVVVVIHRVGGRDGGEEPGGAVQEGRSPGITAGLGLGVGFGASDEDALDGAVGRVTNRDGPRAGGLQTCVAVLLPQPEDPLGSAEPIEDVDLQQLVDDFAAGFADLGRLAAAPVGVRI